MKSRNSLSGPQTFALCKWVETHRAELEGKAVRYTRLAKRAAEAVGFAVTVSNLQSALAAVGVTVLAARGQRAGRGAAPRVLAAAVIDLATAMRVVAAQVSDLMAALNHQPAEAFAALDGGELLLPAEVFHISQGRRMDAGGKGGGA